MVSTIYPPLKKIRAACSIACQAEQQTYLGGTRWAVATTTSDAVAVLRNPQNFASLWLFRLGSGTLELSAWSVAAEKCRTEACIGSDQPTLRAA